MTVCLLDDFASTKNKSGSHIWSIIFESTQNDRESCLFVKFPYAKRSSFHICLTARS